MDEKTNQIEEIALTMSQHFIGIFRDEENRAPAPRIDINDGNATDVCTASILALKSIVQTLCPETRQGDLIDFVGLINRLAFQYLLEFGEVIK